MTEDLPPTAGNRIQLEQVILNLVVNGIEAIKEFSDGPREIVLQTAKENPHTLRLSVIDSGRGVKPEELQLLFDPFFTTKLVNVIAHHTNHRRTKHGKSE